MNNPIEGECDGVGAILSCTGTKSRRRRSDFKGRRYIIYDRPPEKKKKKKKSKCPSRNGISALTFLNFAMGSISLAANVVNNINSNNNIANINIANNNNAGNNMNTVMFMPMNGRRRLFRRWSERLVAGDFGDRDICTISETGQKDAEILLSIIASTLKGKRGDDSDIENLELTMEDFNRVERLVLEDMKNRSWPILQSD